MKKAFISPLSQLNSEINCLSLCSEVEFEYSYCRSDWWSGSVHNWSDWVLLRTVDLLLYSSSMLVSFQVVLLSNDCPNQAISSSLTQRLCHSLSQHYCERWILSGSEDIRWVLIADCCSSRSRHFQETVLAK